MSMDAEVYDKDGDVVCEWCGVTQPIDLRELYRLGYELYNRLPKRFRGDKSWRYDFSYPCYSFFELGWGTAKVSNDYVEDAIRFYLRSKSVRLTDAERAILEAALPVFRDARGGYATSFWGGF